jgi:predicted transcriptional regulator
VLPKIDVGDIGALFGATTDADPRDEEIQRLTDELAAHRQRAAAMRADMNRLTLERDTAISTLTRAQDCIGMAIGSPRMHALKPGTDPTGWVMALDSYDEARPINAPMAHLEAVTAGVRRMRNAIEADAGSTNLTPDAAMDEGAKIIAALGAAAGKLLDGLQPAQRKIVQAIAAGKGTPMPRTEIARLAGVSPTSSNVNAKLTQMAGNGLIELVNGDLFQVVGHR